MYQGEDISDFNAKRKLQILKGFSEVQDILQKARQVGDVHPNGKWVWTMMANGKYDWRVMRKPGQHTSNVQPNFQGSNPPVRGQVKSDTDSKKEVKKTEKPNYGRISLDELKKLHPKEFDKYFTNNNQYVSAKFGYEDAVRDKDYSAIGKQYTSKMYRDYTDVEDNSKQRMIEELNKKEVKN